MLQFRSSDNATWKTVCTPFPFISLQIGADLCNRLGHRFFCSWSYLDSVEGFNSSEALEDFPLTIAGLYCEVYEGVLKCMLGVQEGTAPVCTIDQAIWIVCDSGKLQHCTHGHLQEG